MPNYPANEQDNQLFFITTKAADFKHIFESPVIRQILLDTLDHYRLSGRWQLYAFVLMPNHLHFIARSLPGQSISAAIRDFKSHTADRMIRLWIAERNIPALKTVMLPNQTTGREKYQIWERGYLAKSILSAEILAQKIEYIHFNPCQPHWNLAQDPIKYLWSSARFYMSEEKNIIPIDDAKQIFGR